MEKGFFTKRKFEAVPQVTRWQITVPQKRKFAQAFEKWALSGFLPAAAPPWFMRDFFRICDISKPLYMGTMEDVFRWHRDRMQEPKARFEIIEHLHKYPKTSLMGWGDVRAAIVDFLDESGLYQELKFAAEAEIRDQELRTLGELLGKYGCPEQWIGRRLDSDRRAGPFMYSFEISSLLCADDGSVNPF